MEIIANWMKDVIAIATEKLKIQIMTLVIMLGGGAGTEAYLCQEHCSWTPQMLVGFSPSALPWVRTPAGWGQTPQGETSSITQPNVLSASAPPWWAVQSTLSLDCWCAGNTPACSGMWQSQVLLLVKVTCKCRQDGHVTKYDWSPSQRGRCTPP